MKKTIIILLLACMAISANAQLKVYKAKELYKTISSVQNNEIRVATTERKVHYSLLFDELGVYRFIDLGNGKEAKLALLDLYNYSMQLAEGESIQVEDVCPIPIKVTKDATGLTFKWHRYDETPHLTPREILSLYNGLTVFLDELRESLDDYNRHLILGEDWPKK